MNYPTQPPSSSGQYPNGHYPNYPYPQSPGGPFRKSRFFSYLKLFAWLPALTLALALALTAAYVLRQPPAYVSTASLIVAGEMNLSKEGTFSEEKQNFYGTQTELLRSDRLRQTAMRSIQAGLPGLQAVEVELTIRQVPRSAIFELSATGPEPRYTQAFLDAVIKEYFNYRQEQRTDSSLEEIMERRDAKDAELKVANEALAEAGQGRSLSQLRSLSDTENAYLAGLRSEADQLRRDINVIQGLTSGSSSSMPDSQSGANNPAITPQYLSASQNLEMKKLDLKELAQFLKPAHPKIKALEDDIRRAEELVSVYLQQGQAQLMTQLNEKQVKLEGLEASVMEWTNKTYQIELTVTELQKQQFNVDRLKASLDLLNSKIENYDLNRTLDQESVRPLEPVSTAKAIPNGLMGKLIRAAMVGLFLGLGGVYLIEMTDDRLRTLTDVQSRFPQEVVGFIPKVRTRHGELDPIVSQDSRPAFAESWRTIRSALLFTGADKAKPKTILVTSAVPSEGKSTVSVNLARTLALSGARVLLIDGDLRRGAIHDQLNLQSKPGFINCLNPQEATDTEGRPLAQTIRTLALRAEANPDMEQKTSDTELLRKSQESLEEIVRDRIAQSLQQTDIPSLVFLARGSGYDDVGDLLLSPAADIVLQVAHEHFDHVIIDSAPVLAADDTSNVAPKVDGVLFVIRSSYSKGKISGKALEALQLRQAPVLGIVLNRASLHASDGYYYRYKGYYDSKPSNGNGNGNGSSRRRSRRSSSSRSDKSNIPIVGLWKDQQ